MIVCLWLICLLLEFGIFLSGIKYMVDPTLRENSEPFCFIVAVSIFSCTGGHVTRHRGLQ